MHRNHTVRLRDFKFGNTRFQLILVETKWKSVRWTWNLWFKLDSYAKKWAFMTSVKYGTSISWDSSARISPISVFNFFKSQGFRYYYIDNDLLPACLVPGTYFPPLLSHLTARTGATQQTFHNLGIILNIQYYITTDYANKGTDYVMDSFSKLKDIHAATSRGGGKRQCMNIYWQQWKVSAKGTLVYLFCPTLWNRNKRNKWGQFI